MNLRRIIDLLERHLPLTAGDRRVLDTELLQLEGTVKDVGSTIGPGGRVTQMVSGNVSIRQEYGLWIINPDGGATTVALEPDGDVRIGSDVNDVTRTGFNVFSHDQRYNGENLGEGDILFGDNSIGKANMLWDRSTGKMKLRGGQTMQCEIGTDGKFLAGGGNVILDADGLTFLQGYTKGSQIKWNDIGGTFFTLWGYVSTDSFAYVELKKDDDCTLYLSSLTAASEGANINLFNGGLTTLRPSISLYCTYSGFIGPTLDIGFDTSHVRRFAFIYGNVGIGTTDPKSILHVIGLPVYANNAAAVAAGLTAGAFYRTGGDPDPVCVVH